MSTIIVAVVSAMVDEAGCYGAARSVCLKLQRCSCYRVLIRSRGWRTVVTTAASPVGATRQSGGSKPVGFTSDDATPITQKSRGSEQFGFGPVQTIPLQGNVERSLITTHLSGFVRLPSARHSFPARIAVGTYEDVPTSNFVTHEQEKSRIQTAKIILNTGRDFFSAVNWEQFLGSSYNQRCKMLAHIHTHCNTHIHKHALRTHTNENTFQ